LSRVHFGEGFICSKLADLGEALTSRVRLGVAASLPQGLGPPRNPANGSGVARVLSAGISSFGRISRHELFRHRRKAEVDVVRSTDKDPKGEVIAVLNAGSFLRREALLSNDPRVASVRARTAVEVLVIGKNVFTQISEALGPLRDALAQALNRRSIDVWKGEPEVQDLLRGTQLKDLMEPIPHRCSDRKRVCGMWGVRSWRMAMNSFTFRATARRWKSFDDHRFVAAGVPMARP